MSIVHLSEERREGDNELTVPVADRGTVGLAVGMAIGGKTPVVELSSTSRLISALEPLAEAASVASGSEFRVPVVVRVPYGGQAGERVDRPVLDTLASIEGLTTVVASDRSSADGLLYWAVEQGRPVVLLEPRAMAQGDDGSTSDEAVVHREGGHVTLVAYGTGVSAALAAAAHLDAEGIDSTVVQLVRVTPLPAEVIAGAFSKNGRLVVIGDEPAFSQRVVNAALQSAFLYFESPPATASADVGAIVEAARVAVHY